MKLQKGYCRIKLKSGLIAFGEIKEVNDDSITFLGFSPTALGKKIPIKNIVDVEPHNEKDIPPYE